MPEITDEFILSLFSNEKTKEKAFEMLLKKYQKHIYYSARRIVTIHEDADDVTQNVCIKIWKNLDKFRSESSLKTWISRICINEALTYIEKKKRLLNALCSLCATTTRPPTRKCRRFSTLPRAHSKPLTILPQKKSKKIFQSV